MDRTGLCVDIPIVQIGVFVHALAIVLASVFCFYSSIYRTTHSFDSASQPPHIFTHVFSFLFIEFFQLNFFAKNHTAEPNIPSKLCCKRPFVG
jgi:hypothetical protein